MRVDVYIRPQPEGAAPDVAFMDIRVVVEPLNGRAAAGEVLAEMTEKIVGVPCCEIGEVSFVKRKSEGAPGTEEAVPFETARQEASPHIHTLRFVAGEETAGCYEYRYRAWPRRVGPEGHSAPLFDFRAEPGGVNGAGVAFLALPPFAQARVGLHWDLSAMPEGCSAACAFFEGDGERTASREELLYSYYACGALKKEAGRDFGMYWFGEPPFDVAEAAGRLRRLFVYMKTAGTGRRGSARSFSATAMQWRRRWTA